MAEPIAKIKAIDTSKLAGNDQQEAAELRLPFTVEMDGKVFNHTVAIVAEPLTRIHGTATAKDIERVILQQAERIKNLHALAAEMAAKVEVDLVSTKQP